MAEKTLFTGFSQEIALKIASRYSHPPRRNRQHVIRHLQERSERMKREEMRGTLKGYRILIILFAWLVLAGRQMQSLE